MLVEAQAVDDTEDRLYGTERRGDELPAALQHRHSRRARLQACQARLKQEAEAAQAKQTAKLETRQAEEAAMSQKKRGRKPKTAQALAAELDATTKANVTDPDSRIMKTQRSYVQGYNAQAVVTAEQLIVAAEITQQANDIHQLHPMLAQAQENLQAIDHAQAYRHRVGRCGVLQRGQLDGRGAGGARVAGGDEQRLEATQGAARTARSVRADPQAHLTARERMDRALLTKRGRRLYKTRGCTVEPVFGQIKVGRGCDRFMRRGEQACASEWKLLCTTHNLLKLWRSGKARWAKQHRGG